MVQAAAVELLQSGLDAKWWADSWSATAVCETFMIYCLMGKTI